MDEVSQPVIQPPVLEPTKPVVISGVVLAAGTSSRFGEENKLLATVDEKPLIRHAVEPLLETELSEVVVVLGHQKSRVRSSVDDLPVRFAENQVYDNGQGTSVRHGIDAISANADGVLFALGDMPDIRSETIQTLVNSFAAGLGNPIAPVRDGRRGNPVVFGSCYFDELREIDGDTGGRSILQTADNTVFVETDDPGIHRDIDRRADID